MNPVVETLEMSILARIVAPDDPSFPPDLARRVLAMRFDDEAIRRMNELSEKASRGTLSPDETEETDIYDRVGSFLGLLHSKARQSLKKAGLDP
jgi:hypothetical protein